MSIEREMSGSGGWKGVECERERGTEGGGGLDGCGLVARSSVNGAPSAVVLGVRRPCSGR